MAVRPIGVVIASTVAVLAAGLLLFAIPSTRDRADEQRCKYRLQRLGLAVNQWVRDDGFRGFPPISNPAQGEPWRPDRPGSADAVLWSYLHGDIPRPPRPGETAEQHRARLADEAFTVCPLTRLPFWYNEALLRTTPAELLEARSASLIYFHSQRGADGAWPAQAGERPGTWAVSGHGVQVRVTAAEVEDLRRQVLAQTDAQQAEVSGQRRMLERYEQALAAAGGASFTISNLEPRVHVEPR
jgi:hypothetical protein